MENIKTHSFKEFYPTYTNVLGEHNIEKAVRDSQNFLEEEFNDEGLPFELSVVYNGVKLALELFDRIIKGLSYKSHSTEELSIIKVKLMEEIIKKMEPEDLIKALGANTLDDIINILNDRIK